MVKCLHDGNLQQKDTDGDTRVVEIQKGIDIQMLPKKKVKSWSARTNLFKSESIVSDNTGEHENATADSGKLKTRILAWGGNSVGQLGNGLKAGITIIPLWATEVEKILEPDFEIIGIDSGASTNCLLRSDKTVWCWGNGNSFNRDTKPPPVQKVEGLPPIKSLEMGRGYTYCGKTEDNRIWCWTDRDTNARQIEYKEWYEPEEKKSAYNKLRSSFIDFYSGMSGSCAVTDKGKLWCWGVVYSNDGVTARSMQKTDKVFPIEIFLNKKVVSANVGSMQTCALLEDKSAWCWRNILSPSPKRIFNLEEKVRQVFSVAERGCALKEDGTVWCWLSSLKRTEENTVKAKITRLDQIMASEGHPLTEVIKLDNHGYSYFCALRKDASVWCWGGYGDNPNRKDKKEVLQTKAPNGLCNIENVVEISVGAAGAYAVVISPVHYFKKLQNVDRSLEVLSAIHSRDFDRARKMASEAACIQTNLKIAERALHIAVGNAYIDTINALIELGVDIETPTQYVTALLYAAQNAPRRPMNEVIPVLVENGANPYATDDNKSGVLHYLSKWPTAYKEAIEAVVNAVQERENRRLYSNPPASLGLNSLEASEEGCEAGKAVFSEAGKFEINIPSGCSKALMKVWGAGGGGSHRIPTFIRPVGGTGGFSVGIVDLANAEKIEVIVGGGGSSGLGQATGGGGFNGGGDGGGDGYGGGGGGGRSEILFNLDSMFCNSPAYERNISSGTDL